MCFVLSDSFGFSSATKRPADQSQAKPERSGDERTEQPEFALTADDVEHAAQRQGQRGSANDRAQCGADEERLSKVQPAFPSQRQLES
jgi:hypothetical protein